MRIIAISAAAGGVGCSTTAAHVALMLRAWQHPVILLELHPRNQLGTHLGLPQPQNQGWASLAAHGRWWGDAALSAEAGLTMLPFGPSNAQDLSALCQLGNKQPAWLKQQIDALGQPSESVLVIDVGMPTTPLAWQALSIAHAILCCTTPALDSVQASLTLQSQLPSQAWVRALVCRMDARRPTHQEGWKKLRAQWAARLLDDVVHEDEALAQSWALGCTVQLHAQHALSSHDLQGVAHTLHRWLETTPVPTP